jgi:hypothetical protein
MMMSTASGNPVDLRRWRVWVDKNLGETQRNEIRQQQVRDLGAVNKGGPGAMRWALNMTAMEYDFLIAANPELEDPKSPAWLRFIADDASKPFRIGTKV